MSSRLEITDNDRGPLIIIIDTLCLAWILISIFARGAIKAWMIRKFSFDDNIMLLCAIFAIAQSMAILVGALNGLGRHQDTLTAGQLATVQEAVYAGRLLFLPTMMCSKLAVASTLWFLSPVKIHRRLTIALQVIVVLWGVSAFLASAFQCGVPRPWDWTKASCQNRWEGIGEYTAALNLITEVALLVLPTIIIGGLQLNLKRKVEILIPFTCRIFAIAAIAAQMAYLAERSDDQSYTYWIDILLLQVVQCIVVVSTCLVFLRPYLECLQSGFLRVDDIRRKQQSGFPLNGIYAGQTYYKRSKTTDGDHSGDTGISGETANVTETHITSGGPAIGHDESTQNLTRLSEDGQSPTHPNALQGIMETKSWRIESRPFE